MEFLNDTKAQLYHYKCTGIKYCPHLDPALKSYEHNTVEFDEWPLIKYSEEHQQKDLLSTVQDQSASFARFLLQRYQDSRYACQPFGSCVGGRPRIVHLNRVCKYLIGPVIVLIYNYLGFIHAADSWLY